MYDRALSEELSFEDAVLQLKENAHVRTVRDTLARFTGIPAESKSELQAFVVKKMMESSPGANKESTERKVRMWMKDDAVTVRKDSAIELGFALGLSVEKTDELLCRLCQEGFHWRDPDEIIYIYGLMNGLNYQETAAVRDLMTEKKLLGKGHESDSIEALTDIVRDKVVKLSGLKELEEFLRAAGNELGRLHNTAYTIFTEFLDLLRHPDTEIGEEVDESDDRKFPDSEILATYLYRNFIPHSAKDDSLVLDALQKSIRQSWPDAETLSRMLKRKVDVTRKILILLFLATDGGMSKYESDDEYDAVSREEVFLEISGRMDAMLSDCGFAPLDSRVPFDWMMMYCMCADDSIFVDGRVQRFLAEVFPDTEHESGDDYSEDSYDEGKWESNFENAM